MGDQPDFRPDGTCRHRTDGRRHLRQHHDGRRRDERGFRDRAARSPQGGPRGNKEALHGTDRAYEGGRQGDQARILP